MTRVTVSGERSRQVILAVLAIAVLAAAAVGLVGWPSWILLLIAPIPWIIVIGARRGAGIAIGGAVLVSLWLLLAVMMVTTVTGLPMLVTVIVVWLLIGLAGVVVCLRSPDVLRAPSRGAFATYLPAALGGVIWIVAVAATNFVAGASRLSWVMLGDSANNVIFAREILYRGGVGLGPDSNPVPLPSALLAIVMASGRDVSPSALTVHDISAFAQVWIVIIALMCFGVGITAASIARAARAKPLILAIVSAGASLLPLSWFVTGYPLEFGFFNTHVALLVVMAAIVSFLAAGRSPVVALSLQLLAATLLLAIWSPLVLLPGFLALALIVRHWRSLLATRGIGLLILATAFVQVVVYGFGVVLPGLLAQSQFLSAAGGAFGFRKWMIVALAIAALVLAVTTFRRLRNPVVAATGAIVLGSAVGLGSLLFITRNTANPWSYYPLKFAWLASVVIVVLIVGLATAFVARYFRRIWLQLVAIAVIACGTVGFLNWAPSSGVGYVWHNPVEQLMSGSYLGQGDTVADQIFSLATPEQAHVLWHSGEKFEGSVNFWVMQLWSDSMTKNLELKQAAYGLYDPKDIKSLCRIVDLMGGDVVVHTAELRLDQQLQAACPPEAAEVHIQRVK